MTLVLIKHTNMQLISWVFSKKTLPCQMSFRTAFVVTVVLDRFWFRYCSHSQLTQGNQFSTFNSIKPILRNLKCFSLPLRSFCRCFSQRCSADSWQCQWAKSNPAGLNGFVRQINQGPQSVWSNWMAFVKTLAQYLTNAWVPCLGRGW